MKRAEDEKIERQRQAAEVEKKRLEAELMRQK
jgi:hypothetical protein